MRLCQVCKSPIEQERLEGIPDTRLCTEHGREIASYGGEFIISASQERTSKQGSLKLNYGGIATTKQRNDQGIEDLRNNYELRRSR
jgi:hypothetical protein